MSLTDSLRIALRGLSANKMRTGLTMLGIVIGVGAVIALMSVGKGAEATIVSQIQGMGSNLLFVSPGSTQSGGVASSAGSAATLTYEDAMALADNIPMVVGVAPEAYTQGQAIVGPANVRTRITGTTSGYPQVRNFPVARGEFFSRQQEEAKATVVVLGSTTARNLFGDSDPVGQNVRIVTMQGTGFSFKVIGVMAPKGATATGDQDDVIFMPITTLQQKLFSQMTTAGGRTIQVINVQVASQDAMKTTVQQIGELLRKRHRVVQDDFLVRSQEDVLATATEVTGVLTLLLGAIAGIALVVGGIGIMNIMLVSVSERTREIGIRKAVGARRRDVLGQFLVEAVLVSVAGGILGIAIGLGFSQVISGVTVAGQTLRTVVAPESVLLAFAVSAAIGIFFGIYPATRAARLNPIEALRYE